MKKALYLLFISLMTITVSCSNDEDSPSQNTVVMPVTLAIPATDGMTTRAGDPGTAEQFTLPKYAYIYITCQDLSINKDVVVKSSFTLNENSWKKTKISNGDSVYQYTGDINIHLPVSRSTTGKVYAALSSVPLPGLPGNDSEAIGETEESVQNYKFKVTDDVNTELANIYSTPYNYEPNGTDYYGTIYKFNDLTPSLDIVLYHVAARLDLMWNVEQSAQSTTAIKTLTLSLPTADECYIFKPLENTVPSTQRTETITTDVGNQWYGRASKYVIPITRTDNIYKFGAEIETTDGKTRSNNEISTVTPINKNQPFTPWMRGFITVR